METLFRTVEKLNKGDRWVTIAFDMLKPKDVFRMFESDGTPVKDENGNTDFIVASFPIACEPKGNFTINCKKHNFILYKLRVINMIFKFLRERRERKKEQIELLRSIAKSLKELEKTVSFSKDGH